MIYPISHLPTVIKVGVQTESGVEAIGFDLSPWLTRWPDLTLAVWPTRPGERASYIAADTEMVGNVLYWYPNSTDTEKEGAGTVEVVGIGGGKRKSSGVIDTLVKKTSLAVTQETPDPFKPWAEKIMAAADVILNATPSETVILPETEMNQEGTGWVLMTPWEQDIVSGQVYTITYNGTPYDCKAVPVTENGQMFHALGNLALADLPGGNPNTPFCLIAIPNAQVETGGFYGMLLTTETPDSVTLSVVGSGTSEGTPPVQYTITIDQDGVITTDLDSEKLSSMTDAQIQASVTVLEDNGKGYIYTSGVDLVTRMMVADAGIEWVQLRIGKIIDFGSGYVNSAIARYIDFMPDAEPSLSTRWTESMPHMTHWDKGTAYMRYNGRTWEPVGIDQLKADLGLT